jgi:hypothetical protein
MPAHNWYTIFIQIVSGGCYDRLYRALPILFAWFIVGHMVVFPATIRRCRLAREAEEKTTTEKSPQTGPTQDTDKTPSRDPLDVESPAAHDYSSATPVQPRATGQAYSPSMPPVFESLTRRLTSGW